MSEHGGIHLLLQSFFTENQARTHMCYNLPNLKLGLYPGPPHSSQHGNGWAGHLQTMATVLTELTVFTLQWNRGWVLCFHDDATSGHWIWSFYWLLDPKWESIAPPGRSDSLCVAGRHQGGWRPGISLRRTSMAVATPTGCSLLVVGSTSSLLCSFSVTRENLLTLA